MSWFLKLLVVQQSCLSEDHFNVEGELWTSFRVINFNFFSSLRAFYLKTDIPCPAQPSRLHPKRSHHQSSWLSTSRAEKLRACLSGLPGFQVNFKEFNFAFNFHLICKFRCGCGHPRRLRSPQASLAGTARSQERSEKHLRSGQQISLLQQPRIDGRPIGETSMDHRLLDGDWNHPVLRHLLLQRNNRRPEVQQARSVRRNLADLSLGVDDVVLKALAGFETIPVCNFSVSRIACLIKCFNPESGRRREWNWNKLLILI